MSAMTATALPADMLLAGKSPAPTAETAKRGQIAKTAENFEASFLSVMMQSMFQGVDAGAPFGGGEGEQMFKSFMTEAIAKQTAKSGGIGIASIVQKEMLKLQGLS